MHVSYRLEFKFAYILLLVISLAGCGGSGNIKGPANPLITWNPPTVIEAGTVLNGIQLNATASVPGSFAYDPAPGTVLVAGDYTLTATFTPNDKLNYSTTKTNAKVSVKLKTATVTWPPPALITVGTPLSSVQLNATANVPGSFVYNPPAGTVLSAGVNTLSATFTPRDTNNYSTVTVQNQITVNAVTPSGQVKPVITWPAPTAISAGTPLSSTQLNATANVPGTFTYNPPAGTVLTAGVHTLSATFAPADTTAYSTASAQNQITVNASTPVQPVITWNAPASITAGTPLGANQLNATANVPGSFVYNPPAGTVLTAGTHTLSVTFTPNDTTNYAVATATTSIVVTNGTQTQSGPTVNVNPGMSTSEIQSALNGAPTGATVAFAAGNYTITAPLGVPCANLQLTGPVSNQPTATLSATFTNNVILGYNGGCSTLGSIRYLGFANTGAVYFGIGNNSNFTFEHNKVSNLPSYLSNLESESGLFFDGNLSTKLSNVLVQYNTFGDSNSCSAVFALSTDEGGYCAGITVSQGESNTITIQYNVFEHLEEGIHFNQLASWNPGNQDSVCVACVIDTNYLAHYHRIAIEIQVDTPTDPIMLEHNSVVDPINSSWGTFAVSLACCQWGKTMGIEGNSPGLVFNDNLLIASQPCGVLCPPFGVEFWGTGSLGTNSLVEGTFSNGYTWGYGGGSWAINNNYICGPNYPTQGGYISNEEHQSNTPTEIGNVTSATCQTTTSTAPTIGPASGSFSTSQVITLSDSGANTGIWYTTDGSTPVPGSGTAQYYTGPFTISATTVVKAVGMWGAPNQPTSYPAGYGYVPSSVVSATFTKN